MQPGGASPWSGGAAPPPPRLGWDAAPTPPPAHGGGAAAYALVPLASPPPRSPYDALAAAFADEVRALVVDAARSSRTPGSGAPAWRAAQLLQGGGGGGAGGSPGGGGGGAPGTLTAGQRLRLVAHQALHSGSLTVSRRRSRACSARCSFARPPHERTRVLALMRQLRSRLCRPSRPLPPRACSPQLRPPWRCTPRRRPRC